MVTILTFFYTQSIPNVSPFGDKLEKTNIESAKSL